VFLLLLFPSLLLLFPFFLFTFPLTFSPFRR
jgi:hypothetical protein